jgi:hypothetical protein
MCRLRRVPGRARLGTIPYLPHVYAQCILAGMSAPLALPGLMTAAGIVLALGLIVGTFPLLRRITGPDTARNE